MEVRNQQRALLGSEQWLIVKEKKWVLSAGTAIELLVWPECPSLGMTEIALTIGYCTGFCVLHKWTIEAVGTLSKRLSHGTEGHV